MFVESVKFYEYFLILLSTFFFRKLIVSKKRKSVRKTIMTNNIKNPSIDVLGEIKNRLDIIDVVSEHVALKKSGRNYSGLCPFHKEKTPSFSVNPDKGIFKCFGCGAGGDAISFLMKINNNNFHETIIELAQKFGIEMPAYGFTSEKTELKKQILELNKETANFFMKNLLESPEAEKARNYLFNRKINEAVIKRFNIGYSSGKFDSLINYFAAKNVKTDILEKAGLISEKSTGKGFIDRFRNRIMIPILDEKGDFIAFGARALEENQNPKYLNSPDTAVFNKSRSLFALYQAKETIKEQDSVIIMEGFFDVITAHVHGITNVVATLGTALTEQHIKILARYTDSRRIYLAFDSDEAGINATDRGAEIIKSVFSGLGEIKQFDENFAPIADKNNRSVCEIRVISNTTGKDPDEFLRTEGAEAYRNVINNAPLLIDFQINRIIKSSGKIETPQDKAKLTKELIPILSDVQNTIIRNEYIKLVSEKLKINEETLSLEVKKNSQKLIKIKKEISSVLAQQSVEEKHIIAQKNLLSLYFLGSENLPLLCINDYLKEVSFTDESINLIRNEIEISLSKINDPAKLSSDLFARLAGNENAKKTLVDIICSLGDKQEMDAASLEQFIKDHVAYLKHYGFSQRQTQLKTQYHESNNNDVLSLKDQEIVKEMIKQNRSRVESVNN